MKTSNNLYISLSLYLVSFTINLYRPISLPTSCFSNKLRSFQLSPSLDPKGQHNDRACEQLTRQVLRPDRIPGNQSRLIRNLVRFDIQSYILASQLYYILTFELCYKMGADPFTLCMHAMSKAV